MIRIVLPMIIVKYVIHHESFRAADFEKAYYENKGFTVETTLGNIGEYPVTLTVIRVIKNTFFNRLMLVFKGY